MWSLILIKTPAIEWLVYGNALHLRMDTKKSLLYYNEIGPCAQIYNNHSTFISEQRWERLYDILKRKRIFTLDSYNFCVFNGVASKTIHESLCESRFGNWVRDFPADPTVIKCVWCCWEAPTIGSHNLMLRQTLLCTRGSGKAPRRPWMVYAIFRVEDFSWSGELITLWQWHF